MSFSGQKCLFNPHDKFFEKKFNMIFMYLLVPFIVQNFLKKSLKQIQSHENAPFSGPKWPTYLTPNKNFWGKTINITSMYLLALFIDQNFKKCLEWIQRYEDASFLEPIWSIAPNRIFFRKISNIFLIYLLFSFTV